MATRRRVAAFDFDGTLSKRDTLIPFLIEAAGRRRFSVVTSRLGSLGLLGKVPLTDRDHMKELMIRDLLGGRNESTLREHGERYARQVLATKMNDSVVGRLKEHRDSGHEVVLVSASLVYYLDPIARILGVDTVIAVEPTVIDGVLDGTLTHPNVRAEQKSIRLNEWLDQSDGSDSDKKSDTGQRVVELWAYGNSSGDHELLEQADHAFWLGSERKRPENVTQFTSETPIR